MTIFEVPDASKNEVYVSALVDLLFIEEFADTHQALVHFLESDIDSDSQLVSQFLFLTCMKSKLQLYF